MPAHVVYRELPAEVVLLDLETGLYHGLDPAAGRMLRALDRAGGLDGAAALLSAELGRPRSWVARDLAELVAALERRGLLEVQR